MRRLDQLDGSWPTSVSDGRSSGASLGGFIPDLHLHEQEHGHEQFNDDDDENVYYNPDASECMGLDGDNGNDHSRHLYSQNQHEARPSAHRRSAEGNGQSVEAVGKKSTSTPGYTSSLLPVDSGTSSDDDEAVQIVGDTRAHRNITQHNTVGRETRSRSAAKSKGIVWSSLQHGDDDTSGEESAALQKKKTTTGAMKRKRSNDDDDDPDYAPNQSDDGDGDDMDDEAGDIDDQYNRDDYEDDDDDDYRAKRAKGSGREGGQQRNTKRKPSNPKSLNSMLKSKSPVEVEGSMEGLAEMEQRELEEALRRSKEEHAASAAYVDFVDVDARSHGNGSSIRSNRRASASSGAQFL
jgi:hypothetical protein